MATLQEIQIWLLSSRWTLAWCQRSIPWQCQGSSVFYSYLRWWAVGWQRGQCTLASISSACEGQTLTVESRIDWASSREHWWILNRSRNRAQSGTKSPAVAMQILTSLPLQARRGIRWKVRRSRTTYRLRFLYVHPSSQDSSCGRDRSEWFVSDPGVWWSCWAGNASNYWLGSDSKTAFSSGACRGSRTGQVGRNILCRWRLELIRINCC